MWMRSYMNFERLSTVDLVEDYCYVFVEFGVQSAAFQSSRCSYACRAQDPESKNRRAPHRGVNICHGIGSTALISNRRDATEAVVSH